MVKSEIMLAAENIIQDRETRTISAINIIEALNADGFPTMIPRIFIFNLLQFTDVAEESIILSFLVYINDKELFKQELKFNIDKKKRTRAVINLKGLVISEPGTLKFLVIHEGQEIDSYMIPVRPVKIAEVKEIDSAPMKVGVSASEKVKADRRSGKKK